MIKIFSMLFDKKRIKHVSKVGVIETVEREDMSDIEDIYYQYLDQFIKSYNIKN